jgi:membrane protein
VLRGFKRNQGLLLSGAVAYYTLLSFIPLSILILIVLSHFVGEEQLFTTISTYMEMALPGSAVIFTAK